MTRHHRRERGERQFAMVIRAIRTRACASAAVLLNRGVTSTNEEAAMTHVSGQVVD
jgi:hypothetical protein